MSSPTPPPNPSEKKIPLESVNKKNNKKSTSKKSTSNKSHVNKNKSYASTSSSASVKNDNKKVYKVSIRELPSRDFDEEKFKECLRVFTEAMGISPECVDFLHFMPGKLSRKRGPLPGAGFFCVRDEKAFLAISQSSPSSLSFLEGEGSDAQPVLTIASYQKRFRGKGPTDKLSGTIESDADFLSFQNQLKQPVEKVPAADVQLEAKEKISAAVKASQELFVRKETARLKVLASKRSKGRGSSKQAERAIRLAIAASLANKESAEAIKKNPLLQFMKEKAEKKKSAKDNSSVGKKKILTKGLSGKDKGRQEAAAVPKDNSARSSSAQSKAVLTKQGGKAKGGRDRMESGGKGKEKVNDKMQVRVKKGTAGSVDGSSTTASNVTPITVLVKKRSDQGVTDSNSSKGSKSNNGKNTKKNEKAKYDPIVDAKGHGQDDGEKMKARANKNIKNSTRGGEGDLQVPGGNVVIIKTEVSGQQLPQRGASKGNGENVDKKVTKKTAPMQKDSKMKISKKQAPQGISNEGGVNTVKVVAPSLDNADVSVGGRDYAIKHEYNQTDQYTLHSPSHYPVSGNHGNLNPQSQYSSMQTYPQPFYGQQQQSQHHQEYYDHGQSYVPYQDYISFQQGSGINPHASPFSQPPPFEPPTHHVSGLSKSKPNPRATPFNPKNGSRK